MMQFNSYTIYDKVTNEYSFPFFQKNDVLAHRVFDKFLESVDPVAQGDYSLCKNGSFDNSTGELTHGDVVVVTFDNVIDAE